MNLETIAVEPALLRGGVWWDFSTKMPCSPKTSPHESHFCVLVVPFGQEHARALDELRMPHIDDIRKNKGRLPDGIASSIVGAALAKTVLKGWANAELGGESLPYSEQAATELMSSPKWSLLRMFVESAAANEHALLIGEEEQAKGN